MNTDDFGYFSKTVAERLDVSRDTIRSWAIKLEMAGIKFERNDNRQRIYREKEIRLFKNMKELLDLQQPMVDVVKIVTEKAEKGDYDKDETENPEEITPSVIRENNTEITQRKRTENQYNEIMATFQMVVREQAASAERISSMEKNMTQMTEFLSEIMEELKQEKKEKEIYKEKLDLAVAFIQKETEKPQKKGILNRLFGN